MRWVSAFAVAATLAAAFFDQVPASRAQNGNAPWCAVVNIGFENVSQNLQFPIGRRMRAVRSGRQSRLLRAEFSIFAVEIPRKTPFPAPR